MVAFIDDPHRFRNAKAIGRYFGLVPSQDQSGERNRLGHITREGPPVVRQLVAEAAWQAIRRSPTVRAFFERTHRDDPQRQKIALVATAHYLVRVMWAMLRRLAVERTARRLDRGGFALATGGGQSGPADGACPPYPSQTRRSRKSVETQT